MKFAHVNIIARDWKMLSQFYMEVFGCKMVPPLRKQSGTWLSEGTGVADAELEGVHLRLPGMEDNGPTLEIYSYSRKVEVPGSVPNRIGYGHIAFEVEDVEHTMKNVLLKGGSMFGKIVSHDIPGKGVITFTYVKDPEGNLIELQRWDK